MPIINKFTQPMPESFSEFFASPTAVTILLLSVVIAAAFVSTEVGRRLIKAIASGVFIPSIELASPHKDMEEIHRKLEQVIRLAEVKSELSPSNPPEEFVSPKTVPGEPIITGTQRLQSMRLFSAESSVNELQASIDAALISRTTAEKDLSVEQLWGMSCKVAEENNRRRQQSALEESIDHQLGSAASIRRAMLNLFVLFNIGLLLALLFNVSQVLAGKEVILGLYISMATFIVYVYRSSNARVLILLAVKEDLKRYHDAQKYILRFGTKPPTEKDVDVLKLLLLNRVEREGNSEHPYELVLKGISNSNILLKGGKIATSGLRGKTNTERKPNSVE